MAPHQRQRNVAEGVDNNVGRFAQNYQNFQTSCQKFLIAQSLTKSRKNFLFPENHHCSRNVFSVISAKHQCCSTTFYLTTSGTVSALQHQWRLLATKLPFYICVLS
jgi:hypothetical protein